MTEMVGKMAEMKKPMNAWLIKCGSTALNKKSLDCLTSAETICVKQLMVVLLRSFVDEEDSRASFRSSVSRAGVRAMISPAASNVAVAKRSLTKAMNLVNFSGTDA